MTLSLLAALHRRPLLQRSALLAAAALIALGLPWFLYPPVATDILCWGLFAVALDLLLGYTGLLSFGHAAFWGAAAYATGLIAIHTGMPFYLATLGGAGVAALLAVPVGYLAVRRSGIYFAMVTLAFAQMIYFTANKWTALTGGENGLQNIPRDLAGLDLSNGFYFYYAALPVIAAGIFAAWRVVHSPVGRILTSLRDNPDRVRALGFSADRYRLAAFVISAFLSGLAGGLHAINHGFATLQDVYWTTSGKVIVMTVLGGIGTLWGGIIGAAILVRLEDWLSGAGFQEVDLITGVIFIVAMQLFRKGLWGTARDLLRSRTGRHQPNAAPPEDEATSPLPRTPASRP